MEQIKVEHLYKDFKIIDRKPGALNTIKSFFNRKVIIRHAVKDINFVINEGELVGYIGPNGAGKSTTIKMLSGILTPTSGKVTVLGKEPYFQRKENGMHIGIVFGQRSQLFWDLPVLDAFELYKKMYKIPDEIYQKNLAYYMKLLDINEFVMQPVRQLSLGQKMRAELCVAILHDPQILYLDEPTIGLDVLVKSKIRDFIKQLNEEKKTTVLLTTHDMADIEAICDRIILINKGTLLFDGGIQAFRDQFGSTSTLEILFCEEGQEIQDNRFTLLKNEGKKKTYMFDRKQLSKAEAVTYVTRSWDIDDINLVDTNVEEIVKMIYGNEANK